MKIGIDCRLWQESGVGRYIRNLVRELGEIDKKNNYVLFVLDKDYQDIQSQFKKHIHRFKLVRANIRWHSFREQIEFPSILDKENLDLMHFTYFSVPIFYSKPFIVTVHDLIIDHFPTGEASTLFAPLYVLKRVGYKFVISLASKRSKRIIAVSNATRQEIIEHLGIDRNKIEVIYEGVNSLAQSSKLKDQDYKSKFKNYRYFLYVGNAYPHKNLKRLIEAFNLFCHPELVSGSQLRLDSDLRQTDTKMVLVGQEDFFYKELKNKVIKMGLDKDIVFAGWVSDRELFYLYKNAIAAIVPSLMEGFGLPALEAMANGCLVLASDIPPLREICKDGAIYFDPYDVNDLKEKMERVYSNDIYHLSEKREKDLERAKMFSWHKMARETLQVYNAVKR